MADGNGKGLCVLTAFGLCFGHGVEEGAGVRLRDRAMKRTKGTNKQYLKRRPP